MIVGKGGSPAVKKMISVTESAMWEGIEQVKAGAHIGDIGYAGKTRAATKCQISDAFYGVGNVRVFAPCNQCVGGRFYDSIAIVATVICGVLGIHGNAGKPRATDESHIAYARHILGNMDGGNVGTIAESAISNACHARWNVD